MPRPWVPYIIGTNLLTKFHDDQTIYVASRECTRFYYSYLWKNATHPYIIGTNCLTKFHEDRTLEKNATHLGKWTINVVSRVLTRKNAPPPGDNVFKAIKTIFKLIQDTIETNLLTKFREDRNINVASRENAPPPGGHVFQPTSIIFELVQDIIGINFLAKFHDDWTINVASLEKNAKHLGSHIF
ncbi:hypothetical protein DPMN_072364 [Dreissena polymorpha]|uniref:Uncharacterized protein n=1 Tax=Dreissena polymorpha TaxID=45954 RepID=A0A9D3Z6B4_DREPO|nr:hypothetical protein DPMN_072364 [Dreissena polymorpha]